MFFRLYGFFLFAYISYASDSNENRAKFIDGIIKVGKYCKLSDGDIKISSSFNLNGIITISDVEIKDKQLITCKIVKGELEYEGQIYGTGHYFKDGVWEKNDQDLSKSDDSLDSEEIEEQKLSKKYPDLGIVNITKRTPPVTKNKQTSTSEDIEEDSDSDTDESDEDQQKPKNKIINEREIPMNRVKNKIPGIGIIKIDGKKVPSNIVVTDNSVSVSYQLTKTDPKTGDLVTYVGGKEVRRIKNKKN